MKSLHGPGRLRGAASTIIFFLAGAAQAGSPGRTALDTFVRPGGQGYFALSLSPNVPQPQTAPSDVVVLFDTSASQAGDYRVKALAVLDALLASLDKADRVALVAVDVRAVKLTPSFTSVGSPQLVLARAALDRRVPLGSTDMAAALEAGLQMAQAGESVRARSLAYVGDGMSAAQLVSTHRFQQILELLVEARVAVNSFAIGPRLDNELLAALANHSGGLITVDADELTARTAGQQLAAAAKGAVVWPSAIVLPEGLRDSIPKQTPPLRFDRDSIVLGRFEQVAVGDPQLSVRLRGELSGKPVVLDWQVAVTQPHEENAYLAQVVEAASPSGGIGLPTVGTRGLAEMRRLIDYHAHQPTHLTQAGRSDEAGHRDEAIPANSPPAEAPEGDLLSEIERQDRAFAGFLQAEVGKTLNQTRTTMSADPRQAEGTLKLLLDKVRRASEVGPDLRTQMVDQIEATLRSARRQAEIKTERDLQAHQAAAEGEARERITRELFLQEQKVDQLMSRFNALMDEERYRDAEALADIAEEMRPGTPGLRGAELTARTVGYTADMAAVRDMRHKGLVDAAFQVELSLVPTSDDPPIIYPNPEVWQLITERRKKFKAVDLTQHGPSEAQILGALEEKTDLDFAEQPLTDVVDYLKQRHNIEIQLDNKALTDAGVGSNTPVTRSIKGITLRSALKLLLNELDMTYVIRNEVLMITSKTEAENLLSHRVYPVADLVVPIRPPPQNMGMGGMGGGFLGGGMGGGMGGGSYGGMGGGMGGMPMGMGMGGMGMGMGGMGGGMGGGMF